MKWLFYFLPAVGGGLIQGMTGFGSGILLALFYPWLLGVTYTAAINQALAVLICTANVFRYRRYVQLRTALRPVLLYLPLYLTALKAAGKTDASTLKPALGIFLIVLSLYFLLFSDRIRLHASIGPMLVCVSISAVVDAFFGLGGPAMVIYFLSAVNDKKAYLGTIQCFFLTTSLYGVTARILSGAFPASLLPAWLTAAVGVLCGLFLAGRLVEKVNIEQIKHYTYLMIGAAGAATLFAAIKS